jgi:hypothetical protein
MDDTAAMPWEFLKTFVKRKAFNAVCPSVAHIHYGGIQTSTRRNIAIAVTSR